MSYPEHAFPDWFGRNRQKDPLLLHAWRQAPLTYSPRQMIAPGWSVDHYEVILGKDSSGELFRRAAELTMNNRFYPLDVLTTTSDYQSENRPVQAGDRVLQRIRVFQLGNWPVLEMLSMNEVIEVIQEPRRAGFTYVTTAAHSEVGEWSPVVEWRKNDEVILVIDVISNMRAGIPDYWQRMARRLQLNAHQRSIQNFKAQLFGHGLNAPTGRMEFPVDLLPVGMLATALVLFLWAVFGFVRKTDQ